MNNEVKQEWLKALRSGDYKQGEGQLRNGDTYCCLGVLTDLYCKQNNGDSWNDVASYSDGRLPHRVRTWADLQSGDPRVGHDDNGTMTNLSALNDSGRSFNDIADLIERYL